MSEQVDNKQNKVAPDIEGFTALENTKIRVVEVYLRLGMDMTYSCFMANLSPNTMANWVREGTAKPESKHGALLTRLRQAVGNLEAGLLKELNLTHVMGRKAEYEDRLVKEVTKPDGSVEKTYERVLVKSEIKPDPRVAEWLLSRRFKQKWGDSLDINLTKDLLATELQRPSGERTKTAEESIKLLQHYTDQLKTLQEMDDMETDKQDDVIDVDVVTES